MTARALSGDLDIFGTDVLLELLQANPQAGYDLSAVSTIDSAAALILWRHWGSTIPDQVVLSDRQRLLFDRLAPLDDQAVAESKAAQPRRDARDQNFLQHTRGLLTTLGQLLLDLVYVLRRPSRFPLSDTSAACYRSGVAGLPITTLVGFLIGIVLSYLSSLSLRDFGAESFLPMVMGIGVVRELGPMLTAIVIAGRSGSAVTAGLGAMRLTQELDALQALGISRSLRLVLPRAVALTLMLPVLAACTNVAALFGGMLAGVIELDLSAQAFLLGLRNDVPASDMWIGLFKSVVFGIAIAVISCYFGLSTRASTNSLALNTTRSVVLSISIIILLDAMFAILFKDI